MQTVSFITLIQKSVPNWSRDNLREICNEVNFIMMAKELPSQLVIDTTTGHFPLFTTTAGTYTYDINTTNGFSDDGWKVVAVKEYIDDETFEYPDVILKEATVDDVANITFRLDPNGSQYYIHFYKKPTTISSESVNFDVPERFHLTHFYEGVMGLIEQMDNGRSLRWSNFLTVSLPQFWAEMSKGDYHIKSFVTPCGY